MLKVKSNLVWHLLGSSAVAACLAGVSLAQETVESAAIVDDPSASEEAIQSPASDSETSRRFETVTVTAQKRSQDINDVGMSISALDGDAFKDRQINTLADIALTVPGLSFTLSGSNTPVYTLRGIGFYETTLGAYPTVSVYLDEAPLAFPVLQSHSAFDLERVEVLKGPQGTLFGNNATGGAINYIAAKPTETFEAGATLGYGRFDTYTGEGYISGPITDTVGLRIAAKATTSDDWQESYTAPGLTTGASDVFAGRIILDAEPTENLRMSLNLNGWVDKSDPQAVQFIEYRPNFPGAPSPVSTYPTAPADSRAADFSPSINPGSDNSLLQITGRVDYDLNSYLTLTSLTNYVSYDQDMSYDGDGVILKDFDLRQFDGDISSFSQELRIASAGDRAFRWILGVNYSEESADDDYILEYEDSTVSSGAGIQTSGYRSAQDMKNTAVFGNAEYDIGDFTLNAGIRYTESERDVASCFYSFPGSPSFDAFGGLYQFISDTLRTGAGLPTATFPYDDCLTVDNTGILGADPTYIPGEFLGTLPEDNVSYRVGVDWDFSNDVLLYANVAKGYKAGSFPSAAAATTAQLLGVTQESLLAYEAGFKSTIFNGTVQANGAVFYYDYEDKQLRSKLIDPIFGVLDALVNIPTSSVTGAEAELVFRPIDGMNAYLTYVYIDTEIDEFTGFSGAGVLDDFSGSPFPYSPENQLNAGISYDFPISTDINAFVGADAVYRDATTAIIGNAPGYEIDDYSLLDLRAGLRASDDSWQVMVWGKNVTDEYYWTNVASYYDTVARYAGRPATYGVSFSVRFE